MYTKVQLPNIKISTYSNLEVTIAIIKIPAYAVVQKDK